MYRKCERGFSFVEFMMAATVLSFVTSGVKTFVFERNPGPTRRIARQEMAEQGRASVERMVRELELAGNSPQHRANPNDAAGPADYEIVTEYADNGDLPLFQYGRDPYSGFTEPASIRKVWVALPLRPPADPNRPQFRTLRFDGLAQRPASENTVPMAGLQKR